MKHLCYSKIVLLLLFLLSSLFGSLQNKSAMFYFKEKISYPMVGIHNYIIVNPSKTNTYTHGFKLYNYKIYAHITKLKQIKDLQKKGFKNFYVDIKNINKQILSKLENYSANNFILKSSLKNIKKYPINIQAIVVENTDPKLYPKLEKKLYNAHIDLIDIHYLNNYKLKKLLKILQNKQEELKNHHFKHIIPFYSIEDFGIYGISTKNAIKREIFVLIDEKAEIRNEQAAHLYGAMPLEYQGYIEELYDINQGLPNPFDMLHYAGIIIWLNSSYPNPGKLTNWVLSLNKLGIKTVYADTFGSEIDNSFLEKLGITIEEPNPKASQLSIIQKDPMIGYETQPLLSGIGLYLHVKNAKPLLSVEDNMGGRSILAAITPWGGYAISNALMLDDKNIWIINPFIFFKKALRLPVIPVPDPTTENGNRIFFTHVDGDGIMNEAEFNPDLFSGDTIYNEILKKYNNLPHSISVIGAEILPNGLYPKLSPRLLKLVQKIFALKNVEPASHTFSHPFFWEKIKNDTLSGDYRLDPDGYHFSLNYEIKGMLKYIDEKLLTQTKLPRAKTVFWSGNCIPQENALEIAYKNNFLNINGGDTVISNAEPYISYVAPLGIKRGEYYQIYTGAQNENVFTNDWLGPFWGFKNVVQTFKLTEKPRRLKPIDVYYHFYTGSKKASLNALRYVLNWVQKQEILPMFASEYVKRVMDFYTISMAQENKTYFLSGMQNLHTLRFMQNDYNYKKTADILGSRIINNKTYLSLDNQLEHIINRSKKSKKSAYLISSNAFVKKHTNTDNTDKIIWQGYSNIKLKYFIPSNCTISSSVNPIIKTIKNNIVSLKFNTKKVSINVRCK